MTDVLSVQSNAAPVFDIQSRRAARPADKAQLVKNIAEGIDSLNAMVAGWPFRVLRESDLIGAERSLVALQAILIDLRPHITSNTVR